MAVTGSSGTRAISKKYPSVDGLTAETTKQTGHKENLVPSGKSLLKKGSKIGL